MSTAGNSVTLHDVLEICESKRAPLAPELAGYLVLGVAEAISPNTGQIDPRSVVIHDEGGVAVVRAAGATGDAEQSLRILLGRMLEISGAYTVGLSTVAHAANKGSISVLIEELEAALIPVNRAAGRRALARLSREIARVRSSVPQSAVAAPVVIPGLPPRPPPISRKPAPSAFDDESLTRRRSQQQTQVSSPAPPAPPARPASAASPFAAPPRIDPEYDIPTHRQSQPPMSLPQDDVMTLHHAAPVIEPEAMAAGDSPTRVIDSSELLAEVKQPSASGTPVLDAMAGKLFGINEVDSLLSTFEVPSTVEGGQAQRDLKAIAGLSPTPPPMSTGPNDATSGIDALLAMSEPPAKVELGAGPQGGLSAFSAQPRPVTSPDDETATLDVRAARVSSDSYVPIGGEIADPALDATLDAESGKASRAVVNQLPPHLASTGISNSGLDTGPSGGMRSTGPSNPFASPGSVMSRAQSAYAPTEYGTGENSSSKSRAGYSQSASQSADRISEKKSSAVLRFGIVVGLLISAVAATFLVLRSRPDFFASHGGRFFGLDGPAPTSQAGGVAGAGKCRASIVVSHVPVGVEVLLKVGNAPCEVPRMPKGPRLEFVATADGFVPRRAVIAKDDPAWEKDAEGRLRYELAVSLDFSKTNNDAWPMGEPGSEVGGSGEPGTVRVVAKPKNASIWLLAGVGPAAQIEQRCDGDVEILIAGRTREILRVSRREIEATAADPSGLRIVRLQASGGPANAGANGSSGGNSANLLVPAPPSAGIAGDASFPGSSPNLK